jgi:hypothetical protein
VNTFPMTKPSPIATAPRDGTLIRFWCRSKTEPIVGCWSRAFIGWVAYHESIPLIRRDVTEWELIEDQAAARTVPLEQLRRPPATVIIVAKRNRHSVRPCHLAAGPQAGARGGPLMAEGWTRRARTADATLDAPGAPCRGPADLPKLRKQGLGFGGAGSGQNCPGRRVNVLVTRRTRPFSRHPSVPLDRPQAKSRGQAGCRPGTSLPCRAKSLHPLRLVWAHGWTRA